MKITGLKSTVVAVPTHRAKTSEMFAASYRLAILVEVFTDEGLVGIGEAPNPVGAEATKAIIDSTEPLLVGEDPTEPEKLKKKLYAYYNLTHLHIHAACWALNGIDMALWDLTGKACQQPLWRIWGGAFRKKAEFYGSIERAKPEEVAEQARGYIDAGFKTLYMKVGFDEEGDLECIKAIRETAGPHVKIRVDANQSWDAGEAIRIIKKMGEYNLEFVDQPVLMYNIDDLARVRGGVDVRIASHESSWTMYDALNVIKRGAADVIHIDPRFDAGFMGARITAGMAEAAGMPVVMHHFADLGVAVHAYTHLIAAVPNFILANQGGLYKLKDDVIKGGLRKMQDGCLDVPDGPGIGVELDPEKVARYAENYEENIKGKEFSQPWMTPQYMMMQYRRFFGY
jgi:L-alanine-DL-glutamate epimerase-like enolase superfamily enzyme